MKKRILSMLLAAALTLGLMPVSSALGYIPGPVETWPGGFLVRNGYELVGYEGEGGDIEIPEGITVVGYCAFEGHKEITAVTIPQGVTEIGNLAFQYCSNLTQVSIPDSVTVINGSAFVSTGLTSVVIPGSVEMMGSKAFGDCWDLTDVTLERGITEIGNHVFEGSGLTQIVIPDTVTSIGTQAFHECDKLTSATIPSSVTSIGNFAFSPKGIVFNDDLTIYCEPDSAAAAYAKEWATPVLGSFDADGTFVPDQTQEDPEPSPEPSPSASPDPSPSVYPSPSASPAPSPSMTPSPAPSVSPAPSPSGTTSPSPSPSTKPSGGGGGSGGGSGQSTSTPTPPPTPSQKPDFEVDENGVLTEYWGTAADVVIPEGVTAIRNGAFINRRNSIVSVTIPNSMKSIGEHAFSGCTKLEQVKIGKGAIKIEDYAFNSCTSLRQVEFGSGVTEIGRYAFRGCASLTEIVIPDRVKSIGNYAFEDCTKLTHVELGNGVATIGNSAFRNCDQLTQIVIPNNVTKLGHQVFYRNDPTAVISIKGSRGGAAENYIKSTWVNGNSEVFIPGTFVNGQFVADQMPEPTPTPGTGSEEEPAPGETEDAWNHPDFVIDKNGVLLAFKHKNYYTNQREFVVPDGVVEIAAKAFYGNAANKFTLPASVKKIGDRAFENSYYLNEVHIENPDCVLGRYIFENCNTLRSYYLGGREIERPEWLEHQLEQMQNHWKYMINEEAGGAEYEENLAAAKTLLDSIAEGDYRYTYMSHGVYELSNQLCRGKHSDRDRVIAIYQWITDNIYYDLDNTFELGVNNTPTAQKVLNDKKHVCRGYASLFQGMCAAQNIPCVIVSGQSLGEGHEWNAVKVDGTWLWADATWDCKNRYKDKEWVDGVSDLRYCLCPIEYISIDHAPGHLTRENNYDSDKAYGESVAKTLKNETDLSQWALKEVENALCTGLVPRNIQKNYSSEITREEFCVLMVQMIKKHAGDILTPYYKNDSVPNYPFTDTINWDVRTAYALGIVKGTSETTFNPGGKITRQEAATMLARTAKTLNMKAGQSIDFADANALADWSKEGVAFISGVTDPYNGKKVMEGTGGGNFSPVATYSREQAIVTALRLFSAAGNQTIRKAPSGE